MNSLPPEVVMDALKKMKLDPSKAAIAANDPRITWTKEALAACLYDLKTSPSRKIVNPPAALWSTFLQHGTLPELPQPAPKAKGKHEPPSDTNGYQRCEVQGCHADGDLSVCRGLHGFGINPARPGEPDLLCWNCKRPFRDCLGTCPVVVVVEQPAPEVVKVKKPRKVKQEVAA